LVTRGLPETDNGDAGGTRPYQVVGDLIGIGGGRSGCVWGIVRLGDAEREQDEKHEQKHEAEWEGVGFQGF